MKIDNHLPSVIGKGYKTFWSYRGRYRVCKGGRGSKKSYTAALWFISHIMGLPDSNLLVVRKVFDTHRRSTFVQLKTAIRRLGVQDMWKCTSSPMEITYIPTGQKILFVGLDDPLKITSITVEVGYLCWAWFEEAYQIENEDDFDKIDMSIRGTVPAHLFKQITLTLNPWLETHWINGRFFKGKPTDKKELTERGRCFHVEDEDLLAMTTNFRVNEFLDDADRRVFRKMESHNPRRFEIEGNGEWGIAEGMIYDNWEVIEFETKDILTRKNIRSAFGLDFGFTHDPTALICCLFDEEEREIYIFDEHYQKGMMNDAIVEMIKYKGYSKERIVADSAEKKSIAEIKREIRRIDEAKKGPDSVRAGIQYLQQFKIYIHPKCKNVLFEIQNYVWDTDKRTGKPINQPVDNYNHLLDALRYASEAIRFKKEAKAIQNPFAL